MPRYHLSLTDPQMLALKQNAARTGIRVAEQLRRAVDDWLARQAVPGAAAAAGNPAAPGPLRPENNADILQPAPSPNPVFVIPDP